MADFSYAKACGAKCDRCPLSGVGGLVPEPQGPVPPERHSSAWFAVVGQDPGLDEVEHRRPFVGPSGREALAALGASNIRRGDALWLNGIQCQTPRNDPKTFDIRVSRLNRKAKAAWELAVRLGQRVWDASTAPWSGLEGSTIDSERPPALLHPITACAPWVRAELRDLAIRRSSLRVIAFGGVGLDAVGMLFGSTGGRSIMQARGTLWESTLKLPAGGTGPVQIMPTVHPAFVLRQARWRNTFRADVNRAVRWFKGDLGFVPPAMTFDPTPAEVEAFLHSSPDGFYFWDIETLKAEGLDHYDPLDDRLGCVGVGFADRAVVIPFLTYEGKPVTRSQADTEAIRDALRRFFTDPNRTKVGHNAGYYDTIVIEQHFGVTVAPQVDSILVHRAVESELPHSLAYVGSTYTDIHDWKGDHQATQPTSDAEWFRYNAIDVAVTARVFPLLTQRAMARDMARTIRHDHKRQAVCRGLHRAGLRVDEAARMEWETKLEAEMATHVAACQEHVGDQNFNPNSVQQVSRILFGAMGLVPTAWTDTGEPSTNDDVLRGYLFDKTVDERHKPFLLALRLARRTRKLLGTYIWRLRPDRLRNGRIHSDYSAHSMVSERISSSGPNCFSGDTEVLTPAGWARLDTLPDGAEVAEWANGAIRFVPSRKVEGHFSGDMVSVENTHVGLLMTPDHRCLFQRRKKTGAYFVRPASAFPLDARVIHGGVRAGGGFDVPDDMLRLAVAFQADAYVGDHTVELSFSRERKIERLRALLTACGVVFTERTERTKRRRTRFYIRHADAVLQRIRALVTGKEKRFGPWVLQLDARQLAVFVEELFHWDGSYTRRCTYSCSVEHNADIVQAAIALLGWRAHKRVYMPPSGNPNYQIDVTRRAYSLTANAKVGRVPWDGPVYCVEVPSSFVLVRRRGEVVVSGNCQNFPRRIRNVIVPSPGNVFVGADADQLELRYAAALAGAKNYLQAFAEKRDPHAMTAAHCFGQRFTSIDPVADKENWTRVRDVSKRFSYLALYGGQAETAHEALSSTEDKDGRFVYSDLKLKQVKAMRSSWLGANPEFELWWDRTLHLFRAQGFLRDSVLGMRRDFLDGENFNELANFDAQSGGAGVVFLSTFDLLEVLPFEKWGPGTGLVCQVHDALYFEVPEAEAEWVAELVTEKMTRRVPGLDVDFTAKAKIMDNWRDEREDK